VTDTRAAELRVGSRGWPSCELTPRQLCDLELLLNGGFSPLRGFMTRPDYERVCGEMRIADGTLWPMPIALDVTEATAHEVRLGSELALRDAEGVMLAVLHVADVWKPDRTAEARAVFGTTSLSHPGVAQLLNESGPWYAGGELEGLQLPLHYDFEALRLTPRQTRAEFARRGWTRVLAFQTRNPMHRAHQELTLRAADRVNSNLLIHPSVGVTKPGDVDHYTRVRCYQAMIGTYPPETAMLSLLPLAMRMGGPREALWHAIIRKNYGCTHFIVGRDHAGPGNDVAGKPFYGPYEAQQMLQAHEGEVGISVVPFREMAYAPSLDRYVPDDEIPAGVETVNITGTEQRRRLQVGVDLPGWFTSPAVERELRRSVPLRRRQGFTVFFTGLSGAGKSTIANIVEKKLAARGRHTFLLDGDNIRHGLNRDLGFTEADRIENIRRVGEVARLMSDAGLIVLTAFISPFRAERHMVRRMIPEGEFVEVFVDTPLADAEKRDVKGLYAKARAGELKNFTGIDSPYEPPENAEIHIDTTTFSAEEAADLIVERLLGRR
jgi:sulfate adenylyltransferase